MILATRNVVYAVLVDQTVLSMRRPKCDLFLGISLRGRGLCLPQMIPLMIHNLQFQEQAEECIDAS